jgi:hypothetical protein
VGLVSLWALSSKRATGLKKCIYSKYSPLSSTHLWLRCFNFFNLSKNNSFGCAANRKIGNRKSQSQRFISTPTYKPYKYLGLINHVRTCRESSVDIAIRKGLEGRGSIPAEAKAISLLHSVQTDFGPIQPPIQYSGSSLGVKRQGREVGHSLAFSA